MAYTPQQQAENMMKGIKHTYQAVAVRHVHPWYSWALMATAIGFAMGVAYVANQYAQFDASQAAKLPARTLSQTSRSAARTLDLPGRLAMRVNEALIGATDGGVARIETGRLVDLSRGPGVNFDAPRAYNMRTIQGASSFASDLKLLLSGARPFRVSVGASPAHEWLAFGSAGSIPAAFATEGERCDCSGSVSFTVTCTIGGKEVVISRSAHAIANALDTASTPEARDQAFTGAPDPKDSRNKIESAVALGGKNHLRCPDFQCDKNLSACIPKDPPASVSEVLALGEGAGYSCSAKATGDAGIVSKCNATVVNPAQ
jgi:hypothetical protein